MRKPRKIYDKTVDCYCNKTNGETCYRCKCYCHVPIWIRKIVWWIQDGPKLGKLIKRG